MRTPRVIVRSGLTVAAAAALPLAFAGSAAAAPGISVSTSGTTVAVTTSACSEINGSWGTASLLNNRQNTFAEGRQVALSGSATSQSAAWSSVTPGTYTVIVRCSDNSTAGTQSVIVSGATPTATTSPTTTSTATPTMSATASPSRGVMGGLGGAVKDHTTLTLVAGGGLVAAGVGGAAWYLRRRAKPHRF
ncbi:hypothetical protein [Streptomyces chilikensis]|uniref:hypothetical protein n=1 Tax=Streptomyces chilikensis TaxID=1194079 RepID=UPI001409D8A3|nr:hypothetical protein [Streptomyces chilikensis]